VTADRLIEIELPAFEPSSPRAHTSMVRGSCVHEMCVSRRPWRPDILAQLVVFQLLPFLRPLVGPGFSRVADDDQRDRACCACPVADGAAHQPRVSGLTSVVPMLRDVIFECKLVILRYIFFRHEENPFPLHERKF
jgi:hypothetical protein